MRIAFHFELPPQSLFVPFEEAFFRAVLKVEGELHAKLSRGQLILWDPFESRGDVRMLTNRLLDKERMGWLTVVPAVLETKLQRADIFVLVADGLSRKQTAAVDSSLLAEEHYLGAIEVNLANGVHWAVYRERLPLWCRLVGRELRLLHLADEIEGDRDTGIFDHWKSTGLFDRVVWEDIGVQGTILDRYSSFEHQHRVAELEEVLSDRLVGIAGQLLLRIEDLDPRLGDTLLSAFRAFGRAELSDDLSLVATACRRFLARLADALFPPQNDPVNGRKVGAEQYRNRLWAYVEAQIVGSQQELILANLKDLGNRIDRFNDLASKGVHADIDRAEVDRLLTSLLVVTHDILSLAPPGSASRLAPYEADIRSFIHEALEDNGD